MCAQVGGTTTNENSQDAFGIPEFVPPVGGLLQQKTRLILEPENILT